jgi:hypothetical protein
MVTPRRTGIKVVAKERGGALSTPRATLRATGQAPPGAMILQRRIIALGKKLG